MCSTCCTSSIMSCTAEVTQVTHPFWHRRAASGSFTKNVCDSHRTIRLWNPSIMLQILCELKKWLCRLVKEKFMKQGEAQRFHLCVKKKSELRTGGGWESVLWELSFQVIYNFFPLHPLLVSVGGGVLRWLAGLMKRFLCEVLKIL